MLRNLTLVFLLLSLSASAQFSRPAQRIYFSNGFIMVADSAGNNPTPYLTTQVRVADAFPYVEVTIDRQLARYFLPKNFRNGSGIPYNASSTGAALAAYLAAIPVSTSGSNSGISVTKLSQLTDVVGLIKDTTGLASKSMVNAIKATADGIAATLANSQIFEPRFDSLRVAASFPAAGNIYLNSLDNRIHYKSNNIEYRLAVQDSVTNLTQGLAAYYKLDETTNNVISATGNGHNGTVSGSVTRGVSGKYGTAYEFGGGFVVLSGNVNTGTKTTICAWINTSSATTQTIFTVGTGGGLVLRVDVNGTLSLLSRQTAGIGNSTGTVNTGTWVHVAATYDEDSGSYQFLINSAPSGSGTNKKVLSKGGDDNIGSSNGAESFTGKIDEVAIFSRVLSVTEISTVMAKTYPF